MGQVVAGILLLAAGFALGWILRPLLARAQEEAVADAMTPRSGIDRLTGLADRDVFTQHVMRALATDLRTCAVLTIELDGFEEIRERKGRSVANGLLVAAARRLRTGLRPDDVAAHIGNGRLTVLLRSVRDEAEASYAAMRLRESLHQPFSIDLAEVEITTSVGIALGAPGESTPAELIEQSGEALVRAQRSGRSSSAVFERA